MTDRITPKEELQRSVAAAASRAAMRKAGRNRGPQPATVRGRHIIVCGGRNYSDGEELDRCLDLLHSNAPVGRVYHGGATGADALAGAWAERNGIPCEVIEAEWGAHGRSAGPRRNGVMLDLLLDGEPVFGLPSIVVAFPGGNGTADMCRQAQKSGVSVIRMPNAAQQVSS